jgi:hypothetical protein
LNIDSGGETTAEELSYEQCRRVCDLETFDCSSTDGLEPVKEIIGQERAVRALEFGLNIEEKGFNVFVTGRPGTGRRTAIVDFIERLASEMPAPSDWCYVNNFKDPDRPKSIRLPAGRGTEFRKEMERFIEDVREGLKEAFESEEYADKRNQNLEKVEAEKNELTTQINRTASEAGFQLQQSPIGLVLVPVVDGKPIPEQQLSQLSDDVRQNILERRKQTQDKIQSTLRKLRDLERRANESLRGLNRDVAKFVMDPFIANFKEKFEDCEGVIEYLEEVEEDVLENLPQLLGTQQQQQGPFPQMPAPDPTQNYKVNLVVDNSSLEGAPVEME